MVLKNCPLIFRFKLKKRQKKTSSFYFGHFFWNYFSFWSLFEMFFNFGQKNQNLFAKLKRASGILHFLFFENGYMPCLLSLFVISLIREHLFLTPLKIELHLAFMTHDLPLNLSLRNLQSSKMSLFLFNVVQLML